MLARMGEQEAFHLRKAVREIAPENKKYIKRYRDNKIKYRQV